MKNALILLNSICLLSACSNSLKWKHTPNVDVQSGPAMQPANVSYTHTTSVLPIPKGSIVSAIASPESPKPTSPTISLAADSQLTLSTLVEQHTAPVAYAPPAPPTPIQNAQATTFKWFIIASLGFFAIAGLAAYTGHYLAAGKFALAGIALPLLARFFSSALALTVSACLCVGGIVFVIAWYIMKAKILNGSMTPKFDALEKRVNEVISPHS